MLVVSAEKCAARDLVKKSCVVACAGGFVRLSCFTMSGWATGRAAIPSGGGTVGDGSKCGPRD